MWGTITETVELDRPAPIREEEKDTLIAYKVILKNNLTGETETIGRFLPVEEFKSQFLKEMRSEAKRTQKEIICKETRDGDLITVTFSNNEGKSASLIFDLI